MLRMDVKQQRDAFKLIIVPTEQLVKTLTAHTRALKAVKRPLKTFTAESALQNAQAATTVAADYAMNITPESMLQVTPKMHAAVDISRKTILLRRPSPEEATSRWEELPGARQRRPRCKLDNWRDRWR